MNVADAYKLAPRWQDTAECHRARKMGTLDNPLKGGAPNYKATVGKLRPSRRPKGL